MVSHHAIVPIEVVGFGEEDLDVVYEFALEAGLYVYEMGGDLGGLHL